MTHIIHWYQNTQKILIPHFITYPIGNKAALIVDSDYNINEGDIVESKDKIGSKVFTGTVKKIERRPARGQWEVRPDFIEIEI